MEACRQTVRTRIERGDQSDRKRARRRGRALACDVAWVLDCCPDVARKFTASLGLRWADAIRNSMKPICTYPRVARFTASPADLPGQPSNQPRTLRHDRERCLLPIDRVTALWSWFSCLSDAKSDTPVAPATRLWAAGPAVV